MSVISYAHAASSPAPPLHLLPPQMRRRRCGNLPSPFQAVVLVATRLSDMRAFGDFFSEFWHELESQAQWNTAMGRSL